MHPVDAAARYVELSKVDLGAAIRFAHEFENNCQTEDDYHRYLEELERLTA